LPEFDFAIVTVLEIRIIYVTICSLEIGSTLEKVSFSSPRYSSTMDVRLSRLSENCDCSIPTQV